MNRQFIHSNIGIILLAAWISIGLSSCRQSTAKTQFSDVSTPVERTATHAEDLTSETNSNQEVSLPETGIYASVKPGTGLINLRGEPDIDSPIVAQLSEQTVVEVIGSTGPRDWLKIKLDGKEVWAHASLLLVQGDLSAVPMTDEFAAQPTTEPEFDLDAATELVSAMTGEEQLLLDLEGQSAMPNAGLREGWKLIDSWGRTIWFDVETGLLVQIEPPRISHSLGERRSESELRDIAEALAMQHSTQFANLRNELIYSAGEKLGENYFFQWKHSGNSANSFSPLLQIGLTSDGELLSWLNTLDLFQQL